MKTLTLSLTGHRPQKLAGYNLNVDFYQRLFQHLYGIVVKACQKYDRVECHSGMALGADTVWAEVITEAKRRFPGKVTFIADIPSYQQPNRWPKASQDQWHRLVQQADKVVSYERPGVPYVKTLNLRNDGMVEACDCLVAVYDGVSGGGTAHAMSYATRLGKPIIHLHPDKFR